MASILCTNICIEELDGISMMAWFEAVLLMKFPLSERKTLAVVPFVLLLINVRMIDRWFKMLFQLEPSDGY